MTGSSPNKTGPGIDLTQGSIVKNLLRLSLPIMLANFIHTFYNLIDAFWLGKLGEGAKAAVSVTGIAFPLVFTLVSFGAGFGVAATALVARFTGAGQPDRARKTVGQLILIVVVFVAVFLIVGLTFMDQIMTFLHVPAEIFDMAGQYIRIIVIGMAAMMVFMGYQSVAHGLGDTISPMIISIVSVGLNVVLDPLMIFGVGFFPRMEVAGAAWATLISRVVGAVVAILFFMRRNREMIPERSDFVPDKVMLKNIFKIAIPASIGQSVTSFGFLILQGFVNTFGTTVISTFAIGNRMTGIFMMPAMGISNALSSVIGQNLGADNIKRAEESLKKAFILIMVIMGIGSGCIFLFGAQLTRFFIDSPDVVAIGVRMFRVTSFASFIFGGMFVFMGVFNGSGQTGASLRVNIGRLWLFRIPFVYILSGRILDFPFIQHTFIAQFLSILAKPLAAYPYDALWWSMVVSNSLATLWCYLIYRKGKWKTLKFE